MGLHPPCNKITAPRYKEENSSEVITIRITGKLDAAERDGTDPVIPTDRPPASSDATTYFQMAPTTGAKANWIGLPAHQSAGSTIKFGIAPVLGAIWKYVVAS